MGDVQEARHQETRDGRMGVEVRRYCDVISCTERFDERLAVFPSSDAFYRLVHEEDWGEGGTGYGFPVFDVGFSGEDAGVFFGKSPLNSFHIRQPNLFLQRLP
jgi:hypothetical protein